jgi:hypothetical protein
MCERIEVDRGHDDRDRLGFAAMAAFKAILWPEGDEDVRLPLY